MKKNNYIKFFILCCIFIIFVSCHNLKENYIDKEKEYEYIADVTSESKNVFFVGKKDLEFEKIIDNRAKKISINYDKGQVFHNGIAIVFKNNKYGAVDNNYEEIIEPKFYYISFFDDGVASFKKNKEDKYGILDYKGNILLDNKYDFIGNSKNGFLIVRLNDKFGYIKNNGTILIEPKFDYCRNFSEELAAVKKSGKYGYIDNKGNLLIDYQYDYAESFSEGLAAVEKSGKYGYIDNKGNLLIDCKYDCAKKFSFYKAVVSIKDNNYIINKDGKVLFEINKKYSPYGPFCSGYYEQDNLIVSVEVNVFFGHLYGLINDEGELVLKPEYMTISPFDNEKIKGYVGKNELGERVFITKK